MDDIIIIKQKLEIALKGVFLQIERLKEDCFLLYNSTNEGDRWEYNVKRINDERFLKNSIFDTTKWLEEFNIFVEETEDITSELLGNKKIKDLRNMSEHEIDYLKGKGRYQSRYFDKNTKLTASETGITNNDYLIGGRLELSYVEEKFTIVKTILNKNNFTLKI